MEQQTNTNKTTFTARLPKDLKEEMRQMAHAQGYSLNGFFLNALKHYMKEQQKG